MAVQNQDNKVSYVLDGVTLEYEFAFPVEVSSDIKCQVDGEEITGFSVSLGTVGGTVTLEDAGDDGDILVIYRQVPLTQLLILEPNDDMPAENIERAFDKLTYALQQVQEQIDRAAKLDISISDIDVELPTPEASKAIGWNEDGDGFANYSNPAVAEAAAAASAVEAAASASTASTQAGIATTQAGLSNTARIAAQAAQGAAETAQGEAEDARDEILEDTGFIAVAADLEGDNSIGTVATNITNVNKVATIDANVTKVADIDSNVTIVAENIDDVVICATDIDAIKAAPGEADRAESEADRAESEADRAEAAADSIDFTKDNDGTMAANSDDVVPSQKAVVTKINSEISTQRPVVAVALSIVTDAVATDASLGTVFTISATDDFTLSNPTNAYNGQKIIWRIKQDGDGARVITLGNKFTVASEIGEVVLSTAAHTVDYLGAIYNAGDDTFEVVAFAMEQS